MFVASSHDCVTVVSQGSSLLQLGFRFRSTAAESFPVGHVNHMMLRLQYSGYDQKFRTEVVLSALKAYNRMIELDASGEQPLYRPRETARTGSRETRKAGILVQKRRI